MLAYQLQLKVSVTIIRERACQPAVTDPASSHKVSIKDANRHKHLQYIFT